MLKKLFNAGLTILILWATNFFILSNLSVTIKSEAMVTAIICATIVMIAVIVPFIITGGE